MIMNICSIILLKKVICLDMHFCDRNENYLLINEIIMNIYVIKRFLYVCFVWYINTLLILSYTYQYSINNIIYISILFMLIMCNC